MRTTTRLSHASSHRSGHWRAPRASRSSQPAERGPRVPTTGIDGEGTCDPPVLPDVAQPLRIGLGRSRRLHRNSVVGRLGPRADCRSRCEAILYASSIVFAGLVILLVFTREEL